MSTEETRSAASGHRPRLLDLFCGAGGCSVGYERAGFEVVGVDNVPQKHYPFEFILADATEYPLDGFDAIYASPPCQDHMATPHRKHGTGWMLPHTRDRLLEQSAPWVIENVPSAPMRPDFKLCGCMFGLPGLRRERWFETSWHGFALALHHNHTDPTISVVGHGTPSWVREKLGRNPTILEYRAAMGIDWMNRDELSQAIPPAYTEHIGRQLITYVRQGCGMSEFKFGAGRGSDTEGAGARTPYPASSAAPSLARLRELKHAEAAFLVASVAVWREIDERDARPGGYSAAVLTKDTDLRVAERATWNRYRKALDALA